MMGETIHFPFRKRREAMTVGQKNAPRITRILAAAVLLALLLAVMGVPAAAVNNEGPLVETLCFRDVLRLYMLDKASFGENALAEDANGITNAAKRLAEMFSYTVGLNYEGKGENADFFGKDVTAQMGQAPGTAAGQHQAHGRPVLPDGIHPGPHLGKSQGVSLRIGTGKNLGKSRKRNRASKQQRNELFLHDDCRNDIFTKLQK